MRRVGQTKKILIFGIAFIVVGLLLNVGLLGYDLFFRGGGGVVTGLSFRATGDDGILMKITYCFPTGRYSVRTVPEDEGEFIGDGMIDYDGSLGKYRIMVDFGDVEPSTLLAWRLLINETVHRSSVRLKVSVAHPSDHGFVLYICSDVPIWVEETGWSDLNPLCGTLRIPIKLNEK